MWVKICGNTNLEDAQLAVNGGADALGFIFAPSPRQVRESQVRQIVSGLPPEAETYGVFVEASFSQIVATVDACGLKGVQLHRGGDADMWARLKEHFAPRSLKIIPVVRWRIEQKGAGPGSNAGRPSPALLEYSRDPSIDAVLIDSFSAKVEGGTGSAFDWEQARDSFRETAPFLRMIVAGGLHPGNVKQAIHTLRPWGVDVVSGVESAPGKKDPARLLAFIQAARKAAASLDETPAPSPSPAQAQSGQAPVDSGAYFAKASVRERK